MRRFNFAWLFVTVLIATLIGGREQPFGGVSAPRGPS
jgi:hypothetical protein